MDVKLVMFKPDGQRKEFEVRRQVSTLGRGTECTFRIPLLDVSRKHCELTLGEGEIRVRDLASSNGTFVNDRRINETTLSAGDRLSVGPVVFTVQIDGEPAEISPESAAAAALGGAADVAPPAAPAAAAGAPAPPAEEVEALAAVVPLDDDEEIIELEPDEVADLSEVAEDSDPIAALEALAEQSKEEEEKQ